MNEDSWKCSVCVIILACIALHTAFVSAQHIHALSQILIINHIVSHNPSVFEGSKQSNKLHNVAQPLKKNFYVLHICFKHLVVS